MKCAVCKETFTSDWTEEDAQAELAHNFPGTTVTECEIVCDDCFDRMKEFFQWQFPVKPKSTTP